MNTTMTPEQIERELQRQAIAEQRERTGSDEHDDPAIDQYRLVNRVVKRWAIPVLPNDFAARVARQVQDFEERAQFENYTLALMVVIACLAAMFFALPLLVQYAQSVSITARLPWPMLWATIFALTFAIVIDKFSGQHRFPGK